MWGFSTELPKINLNFGPVAPNWEAGVKERSNWRQPGSKKHPIDGRSAGEVEEVDRVELLYEGACPIFKDFRNRLVVGDRKGQVEIRPAISLAKSQGSDSRTCNNAGVCGSQLEHTVTNEVTIFISEHDKP